MDKTRVSDLVFGNDGIIMTESLEVLVMALEVLQVEAKPLRLLSRFFLDETTICTYMWRGHRYL